jgi:hypothetical protein
MMTTSAIPLSILGLKNFNQHGKSMCLSEGVAQAFV